MAGIISGKSQRLFYRVCQHGKTHNKARQNRPSGWTRQRAPLLAVLCAMKFNPIEQAILDWFIKNCGNSELSALLAAADPGSHEITPIGFFTEIIISGISTSEGENIVYSGCGLFAPELEIYADCILHTVSDFPRSLEVYAIGDGHPLSVSSFEVRAISENIVDDRV